jgi:NTE family protein
VTGASDDLPPVVAAGLAPVRRIATDPAADSPDEGIGLCLSGGGFRAMLFHAGALWRLNEAGYLPRVTRFSSVSGGSITAGLLAMKWSSLAFDGGVGARFEAEVVGPLRALAGRTLDVPCVLLGALTPGQTINDRVVASYRRRLFSDFKLSQLPDAPEFVFNATNLQTGDLWRFSKRLQGDWRVGEMGSPDTELAVAVAASSAFPPVLSPASLSLAPGALHGGDDPQVAREPFTTKVMLADGGVYDNLGLEAVWKRYRTVLVSDGGGHIPDQARAARFWLTQTARVLHVIDNQVRSLRKRQAVGSFAAGERHGTYWGIRSHVGDYGLADPIANPPASAVQRLAGISTRLARLGKAEQEELINWGYLICDTALRRWVDTAQPKGALPYPGTGLGA